MALKLTRDMIEEHRQSVENWLWKNKYTDREAFKLILEFINPGWDADLTLYWTILNLFNKRGDSFFYGHV